MKSAKSTLLFALVALATVSCLALAGCGSAPASSSASASSASAAGSSASASASAASSDNLEFGKKTSTAKVLKIKNETGADITSLGCMPAQTKGNSVVLMAMGESLPAGKTATVYVEPVGQEHFVLSFMCNGQQKQLHDVDFSKGGEVSVRLEGDTAYLTMEVNGNAVSTLDQELEAATAAAAAKPAANAANQNNQQEDEEVYYEEDEEVYDEGEDAYYEDGGEGEGDPEQSEDACVEDIVLN